MLKKTAKNSIVEISQTLNTMRNGFATMAEQRLFLIYLSRINPRYPENSKIRLSIEEFCKICDIENKREITKIEKLTKTILQKIVTVYEETGEFRNYVLFDESSVIQDKETGEWYFELCASKKSEFLFFALKRYVMFNLEYALSLKSLNQMRIYTLLKQHEYREDKKLKISLTELREILGLKTEEQTDYRYFKRDVLEVCRKEINENTDIEFTYKGIRGKGRGGRIVAVEFAIYKNQNVKYKEPDIINMYPTNNVEYTLSSKSNMTDNKFLTLPINDCTDICYIEPPKIYFDQKNKKLVLIGEPYDYPNNDCYAAVCEYVFSEWEINDLIGIVKEYTPHRSQYEDYEEILATVFSREYKFFLSEVAIRHGTEKQVIYYYKFFRKILENKLEKFEKESTKKLNQAIQELKTI